MTSKLTAEELLDLAKPPSTEKPVPGLVTPSKKAKKVALIANSQAIKEKSDAEGLRIADLKQQTLDRIEEQLRYAELVEAVQVLTVLERLQKNRDDRGLDKPIQGLMGYLMELEKERKEAKEIIEEKEAEVIEIKPRVTAESVKDFF